MSRFSGSKSGAMGGGVRPRKRGPSTVQENGILASAGMSGKKVNRSGTWSGRGSQTAAQNAGADLPFTAPEVAAELARWLVHLAAERRMSAKTVEAYRRDAHQFLSFLADHLGGRPTLANLAALAPADVRAFMAARRAEGISSRSLSMPV